MAKSVKKTPRHWGRVPLIFSVSLLAMAVNAPADPVPAPTMPPSIPAPHREARTCTATVEDEPFDLRQMPDLNSPGNGRVEQGELLISIGYTVDTVDKFYWHKVQTQDPSDNREGWIRHDHISTQANCRPPKIDFQSSGEGPQEAATTDPTAPPEPTNYATPPAQPTDTVSAWSTFTTWIDWISKNRRPVALFVGTFLVTFLVTLLFVLFWRRRVTPSPKAPPTIMAAPTKGKLTSPPPLGAAYLETSVGATGTPLYYPLTPTITAIGRDPGNSIVIDQRFADLDTVSRQHVQITRAGDTFVIKDLGSANGLWIDGRRSRENVLHDGAVLSIGKTQFIFRRNQPGGTP